MNIDFDDLRRANIARLPLFKDKQGNIAHSLPDGSDWRPSDWMTAITGETGELASFLKSARRGDFGHLAMLCTDGSVHPERMPYDIKSKIAKEIADILIYLDLLAYQLRLDLGEIVAQKFNEVSERIGVDIQLTGALE